MSSRVPLYRCVVCAKPYHPAKTRADYKGLCSMGCQHTLAKQQGFGKKDGPRTEWEAIRRVLMERRRSLPGSEPLTHVEDMQTADGSGSTPIDYRAVEEPQRHITMMQTPGEWPVWPFLPLKRYPFRGGMFQCGYLLADQSLRFVVFEGAIGTAAPDSASQLTYASYEAIVADGWMVD